MRKKPDISHGNEIIIQELKDSLINQSEYVTPKSNLIPFQKDQTPRELLSKRIDAETRKYQVVAGLTNVQRKILFAKLEMMKVNMSQKDFKGFREVYDKDIAEQVGVSNDAVTGFNQSQTCRDALMICSKMVIEYMYSDIIAALWLHGKKSYQPLIKLLEIIDQYTARQQIQTENKNLNVNVEAQTPATILKQIVTKLGSVGYDKQRLLDEVSEIYDAAKSEGSF